MRTRFFFCLLLSTKILSATTYNWTNGGVPTNVWDTPANWTPAGPPNMAGDVAQLMNGVMTGSTITFSADRPVGTILFDLGTPYTLSAAGGFGPIMDVAAGSAEIQVTTVNGSAAHVIASPLKLNDPLLVTQNSPVNFTISGIISPNVGAPSLTKAGTGTLTLSSVGNTYTGGTTISAGTLSITADNQLGTAGVSIGAATLQFANSAPVTSTRTYTVTGAAIMSTSTTNSVTINAAGTITGAGSLEKQGTGTLVLATAGGNNYVAGTTITAGTLSVSGDNQLGTGNVSMGSATLQFANGAPVVSARNFALTGTAILDTSTGNSVTVNGTVSGAGSLQKSGTGTLVLGAVNSYNGTTISAGILSISNDNQLGTSTGLLNIGTGTLLTTAGITTARSGTFTGAPSVIDTNGNAPTFSGNFSGAGALQVQGGGTVSLTGTNSYTGGTTIAAGTTLSGNTNALQGTMTVNGTAALTFSQSFDGTYSGSITNGTAGAKTVTKAGSGTVTFSGNSAGFTGATNVTAGGLLVNGSLANSSVTVSNGALLGGTGTVGATSNSGTLSPGNSIGTLTINGPLTLTGSSNVLIEISPTSSDSIIVNGVATIAGALTISPEAGFYGFSTDYTIITATGFVLAPGFSSITSTNSNFSPSITFSGTSLLLHVTVIEPFLDFPFSNSNTAAVGGNINALGAAGQIPTGLATVLNSFTGQSFSAINEALDQMHPAPYSAFPELQAELGGQVISLFHRMPYLRCDYCRGSNRLWIEPFGNSLTYKNYGKQLGFQANTGGLAAGYDGVAGENWIVGIGAAWDYTHLDWREHRGHNVINGIYGALYTDYQIERFYLGGAIMGGADLYDTSRHLHFFTTNEHARASFTSIDIMAELRTAYLFGAPTAYFYPYANLGVLYLGTPSFQEHGAGALNLSVSGRNDATLRTEMGLALQVQDTNYDETICISPLFGIGWVNLCPIARPGYHSHFENTHISFETHGWDKTWNLLALDFGLKLDIYCFALALKYNLDISADSHTLLYNQHGDIRFDWKW